METNVLDSETSRMSQMAAFWCIEISCKHSPQVCDSLEEVEFNGWGHICMCYGKEASIVQGRGKQKLQLVVELKGQS